MSNLMSVHELHDSLSDPGLVILDVRFYLGHPQQGRREYEKGHIPGAFYLFLEYDLAAPVTEHGGRHPLPELPVFVDTLHRAGVSNRSRVVAYDSLSNMIAGRLWWMLRFLGHEQVQVLDGGFQAWLEAGYPTSQAIPLPPNGDFNPKPQPQMLASLAEVRAASTDPEALLIDARSAERYRGENETIDKKAGHIPGARSYPYADNLEGGRYRAPAALRERYARAAGAKEVIVYCGSGVSAAHNLIALEEAGIRGAKLYVGSWSDWISYDENPVATGENAP